MRLNHTFAAAILLAATLVSLTALAEENRQGILVWKLEKKQGVSDQEIDSISGYIASEVERVSGLKVISESDINTIMKGEEKKQQCGADNSSCIAEIGSALGVPEVVSGDLGRVGDYWFLNLKRINVRKAEVIKRASRNVEGDINALIRTLPGAVGELFGKEVPPAADANMGRLIIKTEPAGAAVVINGQSSGETPFEKDLPPGDYAVSLSLSGHEKAERKVTVEKGKTADVTLTLNKVYPMNPYKLYGHVTFWTGLGLCAFGGIAVWQADAQGDEYGKTGSSSKRSASKAWEGTAWTAFAVGGAAMITGTVLWILSPGDKEWAEKHQVTAGPTPDGRGGVVMIGGTW